ncbi:hypothetical protein NSB24_01410 [Blautia coccoides]|uniref:PsbP-related protein n=1 Tax=Blautia producta TaxID=33035 RepID=UPI00214A7458|nr:PsbP-related protein [Blautia coccoides]MCR1984892.1 hypothetical protein [Blautia coccoides]
MKRRYYRNKEKYILCFVIGVMILAGIFTFISQKNLDKLDVYLTSDKVNEETGKNKDDELDIDMSVYTDEQNGYSLNIPSDWQEITKNGYKTFVHAPSGSSIQIQVHSYDPLINNAASDVLSTSIANEGKTFVSYTKLSTSSYELKYQDFQSSTYDYIEEVYWDRNQIVKLLCTFNDSNYEKILPYYEKIINSFSWSKKSEIPSDYYLYYNEAANFEMGIPASWTVSQADNTILAMSNESNATLSVTVINSESYLDTVTTTDMAALLKNGKNNFILKDYSCRDKTSATASYTYISGNVQLNSKTYIYANGTYIYFVCIDYESGAVDDDMPETAASLFREFISKE